MRSNEETVAVDCRPAEPASPWLDTAAAAAYLSCTPGTLRSWRARGQGPRYRVVHGKIVRYHRDDLNAFVLGEG